MDDDRIKPLIQKAIDKLGSQEALGRACGCSQNKIWLAKDRGKVDADLAILIEAATDGEVKARDLRPDLPWPAYASAEMAASA
ncbi:MAG: helix-turn-helix domain-containing protein [Actinobacteria bacterium]|nr:helix-turn-helix domain-containing protein [Actinomycetota bacterium]